MIDRSFIEKIEELTRPDAMEIGGVYYTDRTVKPVFHDPRPETLRVRTLTGLVDYLTANVEKVEPSTVMIHVEGPERVSVVEGYGGPTAKRTVYVAAQLDEQMKSYPFETFLDTEEFVILLQSLFVPTEGLAAVLAFAGNMTSEAVQNLADDGITQTVTQRVGVARVQNAAVPNPVPLRPYRTFREVEQPESEFLFRVRDGKQDHLAPRCALFESDGGVWRIEATQAICDYLAQRLDGYAILA